MLFLFLCLLFVIVSIFTFRRVGVSNPYSKGVALAIFLSMVAVVCLAQNYTQSLIPEANDGIGASNQIAYWIIDEHDMSKEEFRNLFEQSFYLALVLIIAYPLVLVVESKLIKKITSGA
ncbi:hypothetical protein [Paenibacillus sp. V4I7]|uniref:hypothetical protein n=1 Tax=Paenibacillus sp. V4I7 TaxID=3042307 RepID=UPI00277F1714|nr:hypothetical protein [Paenibacillus sp. V4I7]MDQ0899912.1 hypothetical protein [Paenibacillus sp. V4I7]